LAYQAPTARQLEAFRLRCQGLPFHQVAAIMGIKKTTAGLLAAAAASSPNQRPNSPSTRRWRSSISENRQMPRRGGALISRIRENEKARGNVTAAG